LFTLSALAAVELVLLLRAQEVVQVVLLGVGLLQHQVALLVLAE
jgi:hypothetical protein